ncbi:MAG: class I SAM-dependent methyltransferase [Pirellulaceae bacterium]
MTSGELAPASTEKSDGRPARLATNSLAGYTEILQAIPLPLRIIALVLLLAFGALSALIAGAVVNSGKDGAANTYTILVIGTLVLCVLAMGILYKVILNLPSVVGNSTLEPLARPLEDSGTEEIQEEVEKHDDIFNFHTGHAAPDVWDRELRPVLSQASLYTVPTYYMDTELNVIDWNIAFGLVFQPILGKLRGRHVNYFIVCLDNRDEVYDKAREFTQQLKRGRLPLVHTETLQYTSGDFRTIRFLKVAVQLHDVDGKHRGWSVALFPKEIDWPTFQDQLERKITDDKLWNVYSASYDRVLKGFPPYQQLIQEVISVVSGPNKRVADLGAGTGNVTRALLTAQHRVTAVENNQGMIDKLRAKKFDPAKVSIVKGSVENLEILPEASHDAAVMVNVLYAVDDPVACLQSVYRVLRPGGVLGLSTTYSETNLTPLLNSIKDYLVTSDQDIKLAADYQAVVEANRHIELTIAKRWSREQYKEWVQQAGFQIIKETESTYEGAVFMLHVRKP